MEERLNQRLVNHERFGPVWLWEHRLGSSDSLVTKVQSLMIHPCPSCHYPYCQTIPVSLGMAEMVGVIGRFQCPECHWTEGLSDMITTWSDICPYCQDNMVVWCSDEEPDIIHCTCCGNTFSHEELEYARGMIEKDK